MAVHTLPTINLGSRAPAYTPAAKTLDIVSGILLEPTTFIKNPSEAGRKVRRRREKIISGDKSAAYDVIGETLTATALLGGGVLGVGTAAGRAAALKLAPKLAPTSIRGALGTATVGGVLITSKTARDYASRVIQDPTKLGREAGVLLDKAVEGKDVGGIPTALKNAGLLGAGVVAGAGAIALGKAAVSKVKGLVSPKQKSSTETLPTSLMIPTYSQSTGSITSSEPVISTTKTAEDMPPPSVVVNNNIKINNSSKSSANRRFINNVHI